MRHEEDWDDRYWIRFALRIVIFVIIISVVFGIVFRAFTPMGGAMFYPGDWIWSLVGVFVLIWVISWTFRHPWGHYMHEERILRRRYARGEITSTQFKKMIKDLKESR